MKIAIDARWIFPETSGIGRYTSLLIRHLHALNPAHEFVLLFDSPEMMERLKGEGGIDWETVLLPYGLFQPRNQWALPLWLRREKVDLYHSPNYLMPLPGFPRHRPGRVRAVVTLHDLIPMVYRDHAPRSRKSQLYPLYAWLMREVAARADAILTVSESSRRDILRLLRLPEKRAQKVRVVYNGLDPAFFAPHQVPRHDPPEILYVGRLDPYKNVPQLVSAFGESLRRLPPGTRLRIIGPPDTRYPEAMRLARQLELFPRMDWEGQVDDATLLEAVRRASVLVLPSEYEGFGLPVAEAMACGTPVICSNASSLPEVAGDAARFVPPGDFKELGVALTEVLGDAALRAGMIEKGRQQARRFQADQMAAATLRVYEEAGGV